MVLCASLKEDDEVGLIADRIVRGLRASFIDGGHDLSVTCSVGIVVTRDPRAIPDQLIRDADEVMYTAKESGRNRFQIYDAAQQLRSGRSLFQSDLNAGH